jgi:dTDP-4-dehydrorhamnose reductase
MDNRNWVKRVLITTRPDVVIYLAGKNDRKWAEQNIRTAELLHATGTATVTSMSDIAQPRMIYVSNSYVFDGSKGNYHESDIVLPDSVLGKMKLGGENIVKSKCLNYVILRTSPILGRGNGDNISFLDRLRMSLDRKLRFEVSNKELHSFTLTDSFCDLMVRLIESGVRNRVIHYGGLTKLSTFDLAKEFAKRFHYDPSLIAATNVIQKKMGGNEEAQLDFSLNSTQAVETLKIKPLLLEESFDLIEKQLVLST